VQLQAFMGFLFMENHNWAAVIPCKYLLAKDITSTQKLLIGLISSLSNLKGYCYASNEYFSECLNVSKITISQSLTDLEKKGYIGRVIYRNEKQQVEKRVLVLIIDLVLNNNIPRIENNNNLPLKNDIGILENPKENINNNKKNNINKNNIAPSKEDVIVFFNQKGSTEEKALMAFEYYETADWHDSRGKKVKNWKQKMLAVWINNNNFNNKTTKNDKLTDYKQLYTSVTESDWARDIDATISTSKK
jgi:uncharacterized membrane protein